MNMFTINASVLIGANVFGVRKADLLTGQYKFPSVVTYTDWFPYPGFTIVPAMTQVIPNTLLLSPELCAPFRDAQPLLGM